MNKITALIVDDEHNSRKALTDFLREYCFDIKTIGEASSVKEAETIIRQQSPDIVFLDIDMPEENGFELFRNIPDPCFYTILVTAYDQFALDAFKYQALDYILKPIDINILLKTVNRIRTLKEYKTNTEQLNALLQNRLHTTMPERIALPVADGIVYAQLDTVIRLEAESNYTMVYFTNQSKILVCRTLGSYEEQLASRGFIRTHSKHLINIKHVEKYQRGRGGYVIMSDHKEVGVSLRRKDALLKLLEGKNPDQA